MRRRSKVGKNLHYVTVFCDVGVLPIQLSVFCYMLKNHTFCQTKCDRPLNTGTEGAGLRGQRKSLVELPANYLSGKREQILSFRW